jgi:hypothetical protein
VIGENEARSAASLVAGATRGFQAGRVHKTDADNDEQRGFQAGRVHKTDTDNDEQRGFQAGRTHEANGGIT